MTTSSVTPSDPIGMATKLERVADDFDKAFPDDLDPEVQRDLRSAASLLRRMEKIEEAAKNVRSDRSTDFWRRVAGEFDLLYADLEVLFAALDEKED